MSFRESALPELGDEFNQRALVGVQRLTGSIFARPCRVYTVVMWAVDIELIARWLTALDAGSREQVVAAIELLQEHGPHLGRPLVDTVTASRHRNMKELRPGSAGR